jgi:hypothetical protein
MAVQGISAFAAMLGLLLIACGKVAPAEKPARTSEVETPATTATIWPSGLNVMGDGYPNPGDPCRRIGESAATVNYLDDSAILIGCPGTSRDEPAAALTRATDGHVVGAVQNVTLISISLGDANVGLGSGATDPKPGSDNQ